MELLSKQPDTPVEAGMPKQFVTAENAAMLCGWRAVVGQGLTATRRPRGYRLMTSGVNCMLATPMKHKRHKPKSKPSIAQRVYGEFQPFLAAAGLERVFAELPEAVRRHMLLGRCGPPTVVFDDDIAKEPFAASLASAFQERVRTQMVNVGALGLDLSVRTILYVVWTLYSSSKYYLEALPGHEGVSAMFRICQRVFDENLSECVAQLRWHVDDLLVREMRFDHRLFRQEFVVAERPGKNRATEVRIFKEGIREAHLTLDGISRPAFQCGSVDGYDHIDWVTWDSKKLKLPGSAQEYPVYVQTHAIRNLYERLSMPSDFSLPIDWLYHSLRTPEFYKGKEDTPLVEYRFLGQKVGYLPVAMVDGKAVVRTFLFLTMAGTPEGEKLHRRLHVSRNGVETMHLDSLGSFLLSDLSADGDLVRILSSCGCGHLFEMAKGLDQGWEAAPLARDVRRYLGMPMPSLPV